MEELVEIPAVQEKRGRGRPRKVHVEGVVEEKEKRPRGRPKKEVDPNQEVGIKRGRGRPRKYTVAMGSNVVKVDSGLLMKHMMLYFTKLLVIHQTLSKESGVLEPLFKRLQILDFQMVDLCKAILGAEYKVGSVDVPPDMQGSGGGLAA